jgi:hypothetical protein
MDRTACTEPQCLYKGALLQWVNAKALNLDPILGSFIKHWNLQFLCASAKLLKATISFVVSVPPSVRMEQISSHWKNFHENLYLNIFRKFNFHSNRTRKRIFHAKSDVHFWSYVAQFYLEWDMFQTQVVEKIKTHILCSITFIFPPKIVSLMR